MIISAKNCAVSVMVENLHNETAVTAVNDLDDLKNILFYGTVDETGL